MEIWKSSILSQSHNYLLGIGKIVGYVIHLLNNCTGQLNIVFAKKIWLKQNCKNNSEYDNNSNNDNNNNCNNNGNNDVNNDDIDNSNNDNNYSNNKMIIIMIKRLR